ncbi:MAG: GNAT family N-acetyltransferase [Chloroflexota bacterium]
MAKKSVKSVQSVVPTLITADQIDKPALEAFLRKVYPPPKANFLHAHGEWWHSGENNRWVLLVDDQTCGEHSRTIAGYCAVIPTRVLIQGEETPAIWWVDLIIAPEFRGRGLQTLFDAKIRNIDVLKLGVPNARAAKIHRKHGWGVRQDYRVFLLPLHPLQLKSLRNVSGLRGKLQRTAALGLTPLTALLRRRLSTYLPHTARRLESPSPDILADVFHRYHPTGLNTTYRDAAYIQWRFLEAPYRNELSFYLAGPGPSPSHYLVIRQFPTQGSLFTRILDLYGDFSDQEGVKDILHLALKDIVSTSSSQVTVMVTLPELKSIFRSLGFLVSTVSRFCWHSFSQASMQALKRSNYWTLADSDNDSPV